MQVIIKSTSSRVDDMVLIETKTIIGENETSSKAGYMVDELMENRFLSGSLEDRIEALRASAERMTETSVRLHFQALVKIATPEPVVEDVSAVPSSELQGTPPEIIKGANTVLVMEGTVATLGVAQALTDAGVKIQEKRGDILIVDDLAGAAKKQMANTEKAMRAPRKPRTTKPKTESK